MVLAGLLAYGAVWEFLNMYEKMGKPAYRKTSAMIAVIIIVVAFFHGQRNVNIYGLLALTVVFGWFMLLYGKNSQQYMEKIFNSVTGLMLVMLPLLPLVLIYIGNGGTEGRFLMLYLILVTKAGDTGAYITGSLTHKIIGNNHKIVPGISPKKSWEGTIGGLALSMTVSWLLFHYMLKNDAPLFSLVAGFVLFFGGFAGDLVESVLKRTAGVKDSNTIIPGMGGVLDVVDSLMLNAPIFYYVFLPFIK